MANQIDPICALQLISAEGPLAAHDGGSARARLTLRVTQRDDGGLGAVPETGHAYRS